MSKVFDTLDFGEILIAYKYFSHSDAKINNIFYKESATDLKESLLDDFFTETSNKDKKEQHLKGSQPGMIVNKAKTLDQIIRSESTNDDKFINVGSEHQFPELGGSMRSTSNTSQVPSLYSKGSQQSDKDGFNSVWDKNNNLFEQPSLKPNRIQSKKPKKKDPELEFPTLPGATEDVFADLMGDNSQPKTQVNKP